MCVFSDNPTAPPRVIGQPGQFHIPIGVAISGDVIYVTDTARVQKLRLADGHVLGTTEGSDDGHLDVPTALCVVDDMV